MKLSRYILPAIFILLGVIIHFGPDWDSDTPSNYFDEEPVIDGCIEEQVATDTGRITTRSWVTKTSYNHYCANYSTKDDDFTQARDFRENYIVMWSPNATDYWGILYDVLYQREKELLLPIVDSLLNIKRETQLSRTEFANVVVAFVQDIPYTYIKGEEGCESREDKNFDCLGNQKHGILSPIEFLHTLKGDCDTRTVLLYSLFKQLGYSPKIANSDVYFHSMLLLDVPSGGDYLIENNQRYYFWETTAKGWQAGDLPPQYHKKKYWEIVLT